MDRKLKNAVPLAVVQHANQFLITNGYTNRPGITEILGTSGGKGLRAVVKLHAAYQVPLNLHLSGTLIEAIAWHDPKFLEEIRTLVSAGLIEIVGSTYAQNIMPLFSAAHNRWQIIEALKLYRRWLGIDPSEVKVFWPPERVWNTSQLAPVLTDPTLPNEGYDVVLLDDRILLSPAKRHQFDANMDIVPELFQARPILGGHGLVALPLSRMARLSIPFETLVHRKNFASLVASASDFPPSSIVIYGDDMEKCGAIAPWNAAGVRWYEAFLRYLKRHDEVEAVLLTPWLRSQTYLGEAWPVAPGAYKELARDFGAGENYLAWAEGEQWQPYAHVLQRVDEVIQCAEAKNPGSDALLELAKKQYAACTFETAWHDAPGSIHGSAASARPTPWAKALAKHAAAAMVTVNARQWARERASGNEASVHIIDLDEDGHEEVVLRNEYLAAVISPRFGGRLVYLFSFFRGEGALLVGNPADDWNWMEELNDYPELPPNHPGALADLGFEHDRYGVHIDRAVSQVGEVSVYLTNEQPGSRARGLVKRIGLTPRSNRLAVRYFQIPTVVRPLQIGFGLSPDYLNLLRGGVECVQSSGKGDEKGFQCGEIAVTVRLEDPDLEWVIPRQPSFGHGFRLDVRSNSPSLKFSLFSHIGWHSC